ncbi:hypothetical protein R9C00_04745 [Flammeovirgaceae bacterium SG7u.111]|nr:hypothetical protein [Flammeovirgaceae bacterium SG7u.132]WPO36751.1 hypothetical protein R9C00_04745 [Flammeovirgaceae bacterium SG7u.111]
MKKLRLLFIIGLFMGSNAVVGQNTIHNTGETILENPNGRTLLIKKDNDDSWLTFLDPNNTWYSMGIDVSNNRAFSLNMGSNLNSSQFVMLPNGQTGLGIANPTHLLTLKSSRPQIAFHDLNGKAAAIEFNEIHNQIRFQKLKNSGTSHDKDLMIIDANTGRVGIGIDYPMHPLDIEGSFRMGSRDNSIKNSKLIIDGPNAIPNANEKINREISFEYLAAGKAKIRSYRGGSWDTYLEFMTSEGSNSGGEPKVRMHIAGDGKVRIGEDNLNISNNDYKLFVETGIISEKVKVALKSGWSDFVFDENYALPSLSEVESFIQENNHLQDIPSAKEVEENGINLGEMDAKLLQKIEELMLYTIEQEKKIEGLEQKNSKLEKQVEKIEALEKLVNQLIEKK